MTDLLKFLFNNLSFNQRQKISDEITNTLIKILTAPENKKELESIVFNMLSDISIRRELARNFMNEITKALTIGVSRDPELREQLRKLLIQAINKHLFLP